MDSILISIKKLIGPGELDDHFDPDIIMLINSALSRLSQLGVGPEGGFRIQNATSTWKDFIGDAENLEDVKEYVYLKVRTVFDPPAKAVLDSFIARIKELEWELNVKVD